MKSLILSVLLISSVFVGQGRAIGESVITLPGVSFGVAVQDEEAPNCWDNDVDPFAGLNICERNHGKGWDVPTRDEIYEIYAHKDEIDKASTQRLHYAYLQDFYTGHQSWDGRENGYRIRCVRRSRK